MMKNKFSKCLIGFICSLCFLYNASASTPAPSWTVEASAGVFEPEDENWNTYYGSDRMIEASVSLAKRFFYVLDIGVAVNYGVDKGSGVQLSSNTTAGSATHEQAPVDVFALLRGRFTAGQWIVPYVGGGYTRFNYRQTVDGHVKTRGGVNGQHARAGLQFLLDVLDRDSASEIYGNWGVINSYLYLEARQTMADIEDPKLDGLSYKIGVMLEY